MNTTVQSLLKAASRTRSSDGVAEATAEVIVDVSPVNDPPGGDIRPRCGG